MQDIVIVGIGPIAEMAWAYFDFDSEYHVVAFQEKKRISMKNMTLIII